MKPCFLEAKEEAENPPLDKITGGASLLENLKAFSIRASSVHRGWWPANDAVCPLNSLQRLMKFVGISKKLHSKPYINGVSATNFLLGAKKYTFDMNVLISILVNEANDADPEYFVIFHSILVCPSWAWVT